VSTNNHLTYDVIKITELASGNKKKHVPFSYLISRSEALIDKDYFPSGFIWKDPWNLSKEAIQDLLNHIRSRQEQYGPDEGFKFHSYLNGKDVVEAQYGRNGNTEKAAARNKKQQMTQKKKREDVAKGKKKGKKSVGLAAGLAAGLAQSAGAVAAEDTAATEDTVADNVTAANGRTAAKANTAAIEGTAGDDFPFPHL
jgi:hypothetical protein